MAITTTRNKPLSLKGRRTVHYEDGFESIDDYSRYFLNPHTKTSERLRGWKKIIKAGGNATTDFDASKEVYKAVPGYALYKRTNLSTGKFFSDSFQGHVYGGGNPPYCWQNTSMDETLAEAIAISRLYKRIKEVRTQLSGPIFLGELRETIRMLRRPASALRTGLDSYISALTKRKGRTKPKNFGKMVSDTWLEYTFGLQPLINDTQDAAIAAARLTNNIRRSRIAAYGRKQEMYDTGTYKSGPIQRQARLNEVEVKYIAGIKASTPSTVTVPEVFGFKLQEFLPTVWNLLPWSFVVDYFVNVGDICEALSQDTSDVAWICRTVRKSGVSTWTWLTDTAININNYEDGYHKEGYSTQEQLQLTQSSVSRRKIQSLGLPPVTIELPNLKQSFNLVALAVSRDRVFR